MFYVVHAFDNPFRLMIDSLTGFFEEKGLAPEDVYVFIDVFACNQARAVSPLWRPAENARRALVHRLSCVALSCRTQHDPAVDWDRGLTWIRPPVVSPSLSPASGAPQSHGHSPLPVFLECRMPGCRFLADVTATPNLQVLVRNGARSSGQADRPRQGER